MRKKATHTGFTRGKKIFVKLRNGEKFIDKFLENTSRTMIFYNMGEINNRDISSATIYKP